MKRFIALVALSTILLTGQRTQADFVIAGWTFETSVPTTAGPHAAEVGTFAASSFASTNSGGTTISNPPGNGSAESFSSNGWNEGEYYQFTTNTIGVQDVTISFAQAASGTGPRDFQFQYSTDGINYMSFGTVYAGPTTDFNGSTFNAANVLPFDLSSISALNNQASVGFRVAISGNASENNGTIAGGGTFRIDDFVIRATAVPEPSSMAFVGLVMLGGVWIRRRR